MYNHADAFTSCIQFRDDASVIAFARELLQNDYPQPQDPSYAEALARFNSAVENALD